MVYSFIYCESEEEIRRIGHSIGLMLSNTKVSDQLDEDVDLSKYQNLFVIAHSQQMISVLNHLRAKLNPTIEFEKGMIIEVGQQHSNLLENDLNQYLHTNEISKYQIVQKQDIYKIAKEIHKVILLPIKPMPKGELQQFIVDFLQAHNTCALASGYDTFIRCTPIEYQYIDGAIYLITEGGLKFIGMLQNKAISLTVYEPYQTMQELKSVQVTGHWSMVEEDSKEYENVFAHRKIPMAVVKRIPISMNVVKIVPVKYEVLHTDLKKIGYDSKQQYFEIE